MELWYAIVDLLPFEWAEPDSMYFMKNALLAGLELPFETILCGRGENCTVRVTDIVTHGVEGLSCTVTTPCGVYPLHIPSPGDYMIYPASMAVAIGERLGLTAQQIREGVAHYVSTGSRMRRIRLPEERLIIDDCYNANPQAMAAALTILADTDCRRRVAVMGDMGELGRLSSDAHREAGALAARLGISLGTLYRHGQSVMEANAWALRLEQADGHARDYFRTLALCRKPRERATFPSLTPEQRALDELHVDEAETYLRAGQFGAGSMQPKVAAAVQFVRSGWRRRAVIASLEQAPAAMRGESGTRIVP